MYSCIPSCGGLYTMGLQLQACFFPAQVGHGVPTGSSAHKLSAPNSTRTASGSVAAAPLLVKGWEFNKKMMKNGWWLAYSSAMLRMVRPKKLGFHPLKPKKLPFETKKLAFHPLKPPICKWMEPLHKSNVAAKSTARSRGQVWWHRRVAPVEIGRDIPWALASSSGCMQRVSASIMLGKFRKK